MTSQLATIQVHLWVLTGVVCALILANVLCNLRRSGHSDGYQKMKELWEAGKHIELLEYANARLQRSPASPMPLMYKTMALLRLRRLDEAEATVKAFKEAAPTMRTEALSLIGTISELRDAVGLTTHSSGRRSGAA